MLTSENPSLLQLSHVFEVIFSVIVWYGFPKNMQRAAMETDISILHIDGNILMLFSKNIINIFFRKLVTSLI